jgi:hypothetical protein
MADALASSEDERNDEIIYPVWLLLLGARCFVWVGIGKNAFIFGRVNGENRASARDD